MGPHYVLMDLYFIDTGEHPLNLSGHRLLGGKMAIPTINVDVFIWHFRSEDAPLPNWITYLLYYSNFKFSAITVLKL